MTMSLSRSLSPRSAIDNANDPLLEKSPKKFRSTNTWLETKKVQNALEERRVLLEEKRVEKLAQLSQGEWIPSSNVVKVTKQIGRHWTTMGHSCMGELYLDPEEALFLLEANTIEIYFNGIPMSLQQAYSILLGSDTGCTLEEYRAFAHLTRFGYKVRRHRPEVGGKRKREEPEIDVVGVIRRKKSSDSVRTENVVVVEDAIEVVDSAKDDGPCSAKDLPSTHPHPSTSHTSNNTISLVDDDDIKFIEIVDTSKKRKVLTSVVINDDIEISLAANGDKSNALSGKVSGIDHDSAHQKGGLKSEVEETTDISIHPVTDCEKLKESNDSSRPSRGMYERNLFTSSAHSSNFPKSIASIDSPSTSHNSCGDEEKSGARKKKISTPVAMDTCDEVIVLSDDETKENDKPAKELLKSYKDISLIELIDISEDDEDGKVANKTSDDSTHRIDGNYDFWGVLGRIPTLEKGRMILRIPAPPPQLIPLNIQPSKGEYVVNVATSLHASVEPVENSTSKQGSEVVRAPRSESQVGTSREGGRVMVSRGRPEHSGCLPHGRGQFEKPWVYPQGCSRSTEGSSHHASTVQASHHQGSSPQHWQQSLGRNPWMALNHQGPPVTYHPNPSVTMNYHPNPSVTMNCWSNQYQTNNGRSLWSSLVYSERQGSGYHNGSQQWSASSVTHFHRSAQQVNYQNSWQNASSQNWTGNRIHHWQGNSSSVHSSRNGGRWQRPVGSWPRRAGSRHYGRGSRNLVPFRRGSSMVNASQDNFSASVIPKVPHARNWLELKIKSEKTKPGESSVEPKAEVNREDSKDIPPLLKPADSINIDAVQSKLQITSSGRDNYYNGPENYTSSLSIKFDLYMPNSNFRKSYPGPPKYRLSIVRSEDRIPKLKDTWYLTKDLNDEVPLLFAVSFTESVNFFSFSNVELPAPMTQ